MKTRPNLFRLSFPLVALAICYLASPVLAAAQTIVLSDSFTVGGSRAAGGGLAETSPEQQVGHAVWKASHPNVFGAFSADGSIITRWRNDNPAMGALPTDMRITLPSSHVGGVMTVSASVVTATSSWVGFGFFRSDFLLNDTQAWFKQENLLTVRFQPNGYWEVASHNGTALTKVVDGNIAGFSATASYTVGLSYDTDTRMARVFLIDGTNETNLYAANGGWFATGISPDASIGATGFRLHPAGANGVNSTVGSYSIDNFMVTSTIPEPASVAALVGLGALGVVVSRRRRDSSRSRV